MLSAELSRIVTDVDYRSPVEKLLALRDWHAAIPALPVSAKMLDALPEKSRHDSRILALLAQRDPVFLTRLRCLAAQPGLTNNKLFATTADDAIGMIGVDNALAAMTELADLQRQSSQPSFADKAQHFVLWRCLTYSLTARRLAAYLGLDGEATSQLLLAVLLDNLGLLIAIYSDCEDAAAIRQDLALRDTHGDFILRNSPLLADYYLLAVRLGQIWEAPNETIEILTSGKNPLHSLLLAVERMVDAKRRQVSQQQALLELIRGHAHWAARLRPGEIDLAVLR